MLSPRSAGVSSAPPPDGKFTLALLMNPRSANTGPMGDLEWREIVAQCLNEWQEMNNGGNTYTPKSEPIEVEPPY